MPLSDEFWADPPPPPAPSRLETVEVMVPGHPNMTVGSRILLNGETLGVIQDINFSNQEGTFIRVAVSPTSAPGVVRHELLQIVARSY